VVDPNAVLPIAVTVSGTSTETKPVFKKAPSEMVVVAGDMVILVSIEQSLYAFAGTTVP
jgi:hypothetical protein